MVLVAPERLLPLSKDAYRLKERITEHKVTELYDAINTVLREADGLKDLHPRRLVGKSELQLEERIASLQSALPPARSACEKVFVERGRNERSSGEEIVLTSTITQAKEQIDDLVEDIKRVKRELGERYEECIKSIQKDIDAWISLYANDPARDFFLTGQAKAYTSQADYFHILGRYEDASKSAQAAVDMWKTLVNRDPKLFNPLLAESCYALALCLSEIKRYEEAAKMMQTAVEIRTSLAEKDPDGFNSLLAYAHYELGYYYSEMGRYEEAVKSSQISVDIRLDLVERDPATFSVGLASSNEDHASNLDELGRYEEAVVSAQQVVDIRTALAARDPESFTADLAVSNHNLAFYLNRLGKHQEALPHITEAVKLERRRAEEKLSSPPVNLAHSLRLMASTEVKLRNYSEAQEAIQECLCIFKTALDAKLSDVEREDNSHGYGRALEVLSEILEETGQRRKAQETAQEAVTAIQESQTQGTLPPRVGQSLGLAKARIERLKATEDLPLKCL